VYSATQGKLEDYYLTRVLAWLNKKDLSFTSHLYKCYAYCCYFSFFSVQQLAKKLFQINFQFKQQIYINLYSKLPAFFLLHSQIIIHESRFKSIFHFLFTLPTKLGCFKNNKKLKMQLALLYIYKHYKFSVESIYKII